MISIFTQNNNYFVWNPNDASKIRSDHRIVGSLIGCVPRNAFQNSQNWLPFQLSPEEAKLLVDKGVANVVSNPAVSSEPSPESVEAYWKNRNEKCAEQVKIYRENYDKMIREKAESIVQGKTNQIGGIGRKHRKRVQNLLQKIETQIKGSEVWPVEGDDDDEEEMEEEEDSCGSKRRRVENSDSSNQKDDVDSTSSNQEVKDVSESSSNKDCESAKTDEELEAQKKAFIERAAAKFQALDSNSCMVQLFTECAWKKPEDNVQVPFSYPQTEEEQLRYAVFKDLWEKGFYITSGLKFGGHYLVYEGDPMRCHALYIVQCIPRSQTFQARDLITNGRVGNQVKKAFVYASINASGLVEYLSLNWASDVMSAQKKTDTVSTVVE